MKIEYLMWRFFLVWDSTDFYSSSYICALLVFAHGNIMPLPREKHSVIIQVIF